MEETASSGDCRAAVTDTKASGPVVNGKLFTWGLGKSGQLGTGKDQTEHTPQLIKLSGGGSKAGAPVQVSCGGLYTGVLTQDGDVFVTGCGKYGRLALGEEKDTLSFVKAALPEKVKQISCGLWHGAAITVSGGLLVWGHRKGCGTTKDSTAGGAQCNAPFLILPASHKVMGVSCGYNFTLAWTEGGEVMAWGSGNNGVLGHGNADDVFSPRPVKALKDEVIVQASAGYSHSAFVTADGKVFVCGKGKDGALGLGKGHLDDATTPRMVTFPEKVQVVEVSCSVGEHHGHTLALTSDGKVYSWGDGYKGKLGHDSQDSKFTPTLISPTHFHEERVSNVCAGGIHSSAATAAGGVYTWGCGSDGRMGHPEGEGHRYLFRSDVPKRVEALESKGKHALISCGLWHGAAITVSGGLLVWGHRKGCGTTKDSTAGGAQCNAPFLILPASHKVMGVSCGYNFTLAWTEGGEVMAWGSGNNGVLGHGNADDVFSPRPVKALKDEVIVQASAGYSHSAFVTADGKVFVCGKGKDGALGLGKGHLDDATTPRMVTFPEKVQVVEVSCSVGEHHGHTLALTSDGKVYSWGDGYKGKLGHDSQDSKFTPTLISPTHFHEERVSNVCAGGIHSSAATAAGGVYTWGCGSDGRMGHPEGEGHRYLFRSDVPKRVEALESKGKHALVSCTYYHTAVIVG